MTFGLSSEPFGQQRFNRMYVPVSSYAFRCSVQLFHIKRCTGKDGLKLRAQCLGQHAVAVRIEYKDAPGHQRLSIAGNSLQMASEAAWATSRTSSTLTNWCCR